MHPLFRPHVPLLVATIVVFVNTYVHCQTEDWPKPRLPFPPRPEVVANSFRFDEAGWLTNARTRPLAFSARVAPGWSGYALSTAGAGPALCVFPEIRADGRTNLLADGPGTLRFWVAPGWASTGAGGTGPGDDVRLLETGVWSSEGAETRCALIVEANGDALRLDLNSAAGTQTILRAGIVWPAGVWHQVSILNSPNGTALFIDAEAVASGSSISWFLPPTIAGQTNGFCIGSDVQGARLAQADFDEITTFDRLLTPTDLAWDYQQNSARAALGPLTTALEALTSSPMPEVTTNNGTSAGLSQRAMLPELYGCALWLEISRATNSSSNVIVTLHNTIPGTNYTLLSKTNLADASWTTETNVTGSATQDWTRVSVPMLGRSNLFFAGSVMRRYSLVTNFTGITFDESGEHPPDTMGAVGLGYFVEVVNGTAAIFNKTNGALVEKTHITNLFAYGTFVVDPRVLYDHQSQRWVAAGIDVNSGNAVLAVTTNSNPCALTNWAKYRLLVKRPGHDTDFTTLGMDVNGIYLTTHHRLGGVTNTGHTIVTIKKPEIYSGTLLTNHFIIDTEQTNSHVWTVQPAVNYDSIATNDYAWLVAKGPPALGSNYQGGAILYRRLQWSNTTSLLLDTDWQPIIQGSNVNYRDYYDADGTNIFIRPSTAWLSAPQPGGASMINLADVGSRLMNVVVRDGFLYTCQHVGLSGTNGAYNGSDTGTNVDRSAVQLIKLRIEGTGLGYYFHSRVLDRSVNNPRHYYFPSVSVNCASDIILGFSGSSTTNYVSGYYGWLAYPGIASDAILLKQGTGTSDDSRWWGDYSATTLDPDEGMSVWTIQEFIREDGSWATFIGKVAMTR